MIENSLGFAALFIEPRNAITDYMSGFECFIIHDTTNSYSMY